MAEVPNVLFEQMFHRLEQFSRIHNNIATTGGATEEQKQDRYLILRALETRMNDILQNMPKGQV